MATRRTAVLCLAFAACQSNERLPPFESVVRADASADAGPTDVPGLDAAIHATDGSTDAGDPDAMSEADAGDAAEPAVCTSQMMRAATESEGPGMMPGYPCIGCHLDTNASDQGDAPIFALAGTVYSAAHEPDGCLSPQAEGAQVIVTDAMGSVFAVDVGDSGNFSLEDALVVPPFHAKITFAGREREMLLPQTSGDCNSCHTTAGANAAPGRLMLP